MQAENNVKSLLKKCRNPLYIALSFLVWAEAASAITITHTSAPKLYYDSGKNITSAYASFLVTNDTASNLADVWVGIGGFTGGVLSLAANEDGVCQLGSLSASQSKTAYFYLSATGVTASAQPFTVSVCASRPPAGALASASFSLAAVEDTIAANANKVTTVVTTPNLPGLGNVGKSQ